MQSVNKAVVLLLVCYIWPSAAFICPPFLKMAAIHSNYRNKRLSSHRAITLISKYWLHSSMFVWEWQSPTHIFASIVWRNKHILFYWKTINGLALWCRMRCCRNISRLANSSAKSFIELTGHVESLERAWDVFCGSNVITDIGCRLSQHRIVFSS